MKNEKEDTWCCYNRHVRELCLSDKEILVIEKFLSLMKEIKLRDTAMKDDIMGLIPHGIYRSEEELRALRF